MAKNKKTDILKEVYSFSHVDNVIRKKWISPHQFLRTTFKERQLTTNPRRDWEIFQEKVLKRKIQYPTAVYKSQKEYERGVLIKPHVQGIKDVIQGKKQSPYRLPIPFLEFNKKGNPVGHEGRHTAKAFQELKIRKIPVTFVKSKS